LLAIDPPPKLAGSNEYGWSFMPTTSQNMGPLHGIPSVPCEGGHLVLIVQIGPCVTTLSNPSLGASNGAQITSPISVQTSNIHKVQRVSKKIVELEMQCRKLDGKKPQSIQVDSGGFVTSRSTNKPRFEDSIRRLCTKYMDVSIVLVKNQNPQDVADFKA